jgi:phosphohistidine phosphatase
VKRIYFLRHGKAVPRAGWTADDALRPLTPDGEAEMQREAKILKGLGIEPDVIVTSPLVRARRTAEIVADALGLTGRLVEDDRLAHGFDVRALGKIAAAHPNAQQMMLVGHEPEFSATVAAVIGGGQLVMKKGGMARVDLPDQSVKSGVLAWLATPALLGGE